MAKKGTRLREFEKNHRVLDITGAQEERRKKKKRKTKKEKNITEDPFTESEETAISKDVTANRKKGPRVRWVKLAGLAICVLFIFVVGASVKNIYNLKERENALEERNQQLEQMKEELLVELENVNSDEYIEEKARRELKLIRSNELVFYFPEDFHLEKKDAASDADNTGNSEDSGN